MVASYNVLIEISQGSENNKYERDPKTGKIVLDFVFQNLVWPFNYGEILNTRGGDGDALDAIVFSTEPLEQGAIVPCLPFGVMFSLDRGQRDDKVLFVPKADSIAKTLRNVADFSQQRKNIVIGLYEKIAKQKNKKVIIEGFGNARQAENLITSSFIPAN